LTALPRRLRLVSAMLVALACSTSFALAYESQSREYNDGGRGNDAGHTRDAALSLPGFGAYGAYLLPYDADWYHVDTSSSGPVCFTANVTSQAPIGRATLIVEQGAQDLGYGQAVPVDATRSYALAANGHTGLKFFVDGTASGAKGDYVFDLRKVTLSDVVFDGGLGRDAGSSASSATPVSEGCFGGRLDPMGFGLGDSRDAYSIQGVANQTMAVTYAATATTGTLQVLAPDGTVLATLTSSNSMATFTLPTSGSYTLMTSTMSMSPFDYLVGLEIGPPGQGCRPQC
jgi:hypothetical protein